MALDLGCGPGNPDNRSTQLELLAVGIIIPWILVGLIVFVTYAMVTQASKQAADVVMRLDALEIGLESMLSGQPQPGASGYVGLNPGVRAPGFALPALTGEARTVSLEDFRGQRVLLMFSRPGCGYCQQMAPGLAALPYDGRDGLPIPVLITTGDEQENRDFIAEHNLQIPVLHQSGVELYAPYLVQGTPQGYLIDTQGNIASDLMTGSDNLFAAFRNSPNGPEKGAPVAPAENNGVGLRITQSHLQREGLSAGAPAPDFVLSDLTGKPVGLADFRGHRVLLVFSDPDCGPCQLLAADLEKLHRGTREYRILMVSRGNLAANQAKAADHGLTFPIVLQRHWEVSRSYAIFKTPVGYLVNAEGFLESGVAVGRDAILNQARSAVGRAGGR